jgi:glucokinase
MLSIPREDDALAREILERAGFYIGLGIVNLLHVFDSQLFVIGGGVATNAWDFLYPSIRAVIDKHAMPAMREGVRVAQAGLGSDSVLAGAVALALDGTRG